MNTTSTVRLARAAGFFRLLVFLAGFHAMTSMSRFIVNGDAAPIAKNLQRCNAAAEAA